MAAVSFRLLTDEAVVDMPIEKSILTTPQRARFAASSLVRTTDYRPCTPENNQQKPRAVHVLNRSKIPGRCRKSTHEWPRALRDTA